jgi:cation:H+ antiporter
MAMHLFLLTLGVVGLWGGTLLAIRGAVQLSDQYGLSHGFVGLAVLAVGTDLPELVVALSGSAQRLQGVDASGVIVGSAFGSAIAQGTLVLGVAGLFGYLPVATRMVRRDGLTLILSIGLAAALAAGGGVARLEGAAMLLAYCIYFVALVQAEQQRREPGVAPPEGSLPAPFAIAVGLVAVTLAAHIVVTEGIAVAATLGVSQTVLGIIVVGVGTSLPELALSVRAAIDKHASLSVGNVIGSNIFDLLVPVGVGAVLYPLSVEENTVVFDLPALGLVTLALLFFLVRKRGLQRSEAAALIALYVGYASLRVMLG